MAFRTFGIWNDILNAYGQQRSQRSRRKSAKRHRTLRFEKCEDRNMLAVFTVNSMLDNSDGANTTLREAVIAASQSLDAEDTVKFDETVFASGGTILLTQSHLSITGTGNVIVDGRATNGIPFGITINAGGGTNGVVGNGDGHTVFQISGATSGQVEINGLRLAGGDSVFDAGAISSSRNLLIKNCVITGNASSVGAGGIGASANLTVENSTITGNSSNGVGGGGIGFDTTYEATLTVISSTISGNDAAAGGGIYVSGDLASASIQSSHITGNEAQSNDGGGIHFAGKSLTVQSTTIRDNLADADGGGLYAYLGPFVTGGSITIAKSTIDMNRTYGNYGGGASLRAINASVTITGTVISNNQALGIEANVGGIAVQAEDNSNVIIDGLRVIGNHADDDVGGLLIINSGSTVNVKNTTISENTAHHNFAQSRDAAGGVWIQAVSGAQTAIESSTISGNKIFTPPGGTNDNPYGGGLFIQAAAGTTTTLLNSTISGNEAEGSGGGIKIADYYSAPQGGQVSILHCTITKNRANSDGDSVGTGGGIHVGTSATTVTLDHTIVAGNFQGAGSTRDDIKRSLPAGAITAAWSLVGDNTGANVTDTIGNQIGTSSLPKDAMLGELANNGGPTMTHSLLAGSLAIDHGNPSALAGSGGIPSFDQRGTGFPRVFNVPDVRDPGARIDIGAYEIGLPKVIDVIISDSTPPNPHLPYSFATAMGLGIHQLRTVPLGTPNTIQIRFSEVVTFSTNPVTVQNVTIGMTIPGAASGSGTSTATWQRTSGDFGAAQIVLTVDDNISGLGGLLDGDWTNPATIYVGNTDAFASGNGTSAGNDDFIFNFTVLRADWNQDNIVNAADYILWAKSNGMTGGASFAAGDANGDGNVNSLDYDIWYMLFGFNFTTWPA
jgi:hypothetical protein